MPPHHLRVGFPALPRGPFTFLEGGQVTFDGTVLRLLVACDRPTAPEVDAVARGPVDLAVYHRDGLAALVAVVGVPEDPGHLETCAPLVLDRYHRDPHVRRRMPNIDTICVQLVLCQARDMVVRAVRDLTVSPRLSRALHEAAHAQARRFDGADDATRAHKIGLRALTVGHLLRHASARDHTSG